MDEGCKGSLETGVVVDRDFVVLEVVTIVGILILGVGATDKRAVQHLSVRVGLAQIAVIARSRTVSARADAKGQNSIFAFHVQYYESEYV